MYNLVDCFEKYGRIMQFNKNKQEPIHRWYPFVEGYSKEFVLSIVNELQVKPQTCLEPFSGSGTTALELQKLGIKCHSFEINPFMYLLSSVKLETSYNIDNVTTYFERIKNQRISLDFKLPETDFYTLYESKNRKKANYSNSVGIAVQKLKLLINKIEEDKYKNLFTVALAAILLDVSHLYRNGKCLSYKSNWKDLNLSEVDVFEIFDKKVTSCILPDILTLNENQNDVSNKVYLYNEDSRIGIDQKIQDNSIDLVITSPPYLNSRDYTDTYMLELKTLGMTPTYESIISLRNKTVRSHVQIRWTDKSKDPDGELAKTMMLLNRAASESNVWNPSIQDMVNLYFVDIRKVFKNLYSKLRTNGKVYFNVSNSAYFGVLVDTLQICSSIAESEGFCIEEIRKARMLKTSPQQKESIGSLLEGVIVMHKKEVA